LEGGLRVYPNPSANGIYHLPFETNYKVFNFGGNVILEGRGVEIDLKSLPKGVFVLKAKGAVIKLVK